MNNTNYYILDSINKIDKNTWDALFGDAPEGYYFYKTLEESNFKDFSFYYALISIDDTPALLAPLFITEFDLAIAAEGIMEKIIIFIRKIIPRFLITKTLFCGSPFGENGILGIKNDIKDNNLILVKLINAMEEFAKEKNIYTIMFKDLPEKETGLLDAPLVKMGFFKVESFPSVVMELNFASFQDYLKSLSYSMRKNLRRKLKKTNHSNEIRVEIKESVNDIIDDVYKLYLNTYNAGGIKFEKLTKEFFINIAQNLKKEVRYFLYYVDSQLAAFNLCFAYKDLLIDKFVGFNYELSEKYNLYFFSWCFNIEWCIKNSIHYYQVGQTDYYPKLKLGGKLIPLYVYLKYRSLLLNFILKSCANLVKPHA